MSDLSDLQTSQAVLDQDIHEVALLSEQGHFDRALRQAQRLLRENPSSARVHELLGDVASRRQDHAEAVQWYELSLRLRYDEAVMEKLQLERTAVAEATAAPAEQAPTAPRRPRHYGLIGGIAGGAVLLGLLVLLFVTLGGRGPDGGSDGSDTYGAATTTAGTSGSGRERSGARATPTPAPDRPAAAQATGAAGGAAAAQGGSGPFRSGQPEAGELPPVHLHRDIGAPLTDQDKSLLAALSSLHWPGGNRLSGDVNVMLDPFSGYAFITIEMPSSLKQAVQFSTALQMAYRVAVATVKHDSSIQSLTIRVIIPVVMGEKQEDAVITAFRGNTNRRTLDRYLREDTEPDSREIWYEVFATCWWNPSLAAAKPFTT